MDTVNSGDISLVCIKTDTHGCAHAKKTWVRWDATENPPQLVYSGLPEHGVMILSKKTVIVCCRACWEAGWGIPLMTR